MLWEIIAAVLAIAFILKFVFRNKKQPDDDPVKIKKKIPGMDPSHPEEGNRDDIKKAKTLSHFILDLHEKYGPIACFWEGKTMSVSLGSPELFKETRQLYNIPTDIFKQFEMLSGPGAMALCEEEEIRRRRKIYDNHFMMKACKSHSAYFVEIAQETTKKWQNLKPNETISIYSTMSKLSLCALARTSFGTYFEDEKNLKNFQDLVDFVFRNFDPMPEKGTEMYKKLEQACHDIKETVRQIMRERKTMVKKEGDRELFLDVLLELDLSEDDQLSDAVGFIGAGYLATGVMLTWFMYEMCRNQDLQEKVYQETVQVLGNKTATVDNIPELRYIRQAIDETLRVYMKNGYGFRKADEDMKLGGYDIPKDSRVYLALGTVFTDPKIWTNPKKFDPDRFSPENSRGRSGFAFKPFGFAGKRTCIGQAFAYSEMTIYIAEWFRHFRFRLEPDEEVKQIDGMFILPEKEITAIVEQRKM